MNSFNLIITTISAARLLTAKDH